METARPIKTIYIYFALLHLGAAAAAFQIQPQGRSTQITRFTQQPQHQQVSNHDAETETKSCFWRHPTKSWEQRVSFEDLEVGQKLTGVVFQELLDGKTGPKMFFDCGVGRIDKNGDWQIVTAMHRIRDRKQSVITKKAAKLRGRKGGIDVWVSRIYRSNYQFEVVVQEGDVSSASAEPKIPASSLAVGQDLVGSVVRIAPYGVFVDVGANRNGLLHIKRVADLFGHYIDKEEGLVEAGLEKGAKIRVTVASNDRKRLFLDFPKDVKAEAEEERGQEEDSKSVVNPVMSAEEAAAWEEFAAAGSGPVVGITSTTMSDSIVPSQEVLASYADYEEDYDYDDDDYDEDRDIEDALGLGMY